MERKERNSNFSLRSTEFRRSEFVGPRTKVHLLDEGYAWVPKTRDFAKDSSYEFGKKRELGLVSFKTIVVEVMNLMLGF